MPNVINNVSDVGKVIAKMAAGMLADKTQFVRNIDKEPETSFGNVNGYNVGDTITISKPARFTTSSGADITSAIQDVKEEKVNLSLDTRSVVPIALTSAEIQNTIGLKDWANRILDPAVSSIAQNIESTFLNVAKNAVYNCVGTAGSTVFDTDTMLSAREKLLKNLAPQNGKFNVLLDSTAMRSAVNARKGLFQSSEQISKQYEDGYMGISDGFTFLENNLLPVHTRGSSIASGEVSVTAAPTEGASTINLTGSGSKTLKKGDVFTIAGVFQVHPITKVATTTLQQFVVTADNTASTGAFSNVAVSPAFYSSTSGTLQNISALPSSSAAVVLVGVASTSYLQNLAFHKSAFRFASVPLMKPDGAHMCAQETVDGMTIRVWMDANVLTDKMIMRLDFLGGFAAVRPEWACRITA